MKKFLKFFLIFLLAIFLLIAVVLTHAGLFEPIIANQENVGPYTIAYQEHRGSYYKTKQSMDNVYEGLLALGVETYQGVGVYYDDPSQVPTDQLRSEVGSVIEEVSPALLDEIKQSFKVKEIPYQRAIIIEFPIRNMLSYMIGPAKVYKEIAQIWQTHNYPDYGYAVEIYDVPNKMITYIIPLEEIAVEQIILEEPLIIDVEGMDASESTNTIDMQFDASQSATNSGTINEDES